MPAALGSGVRGLEMEQREIRCVNRTGAATVVGSLYRLDVAASDGDVADNTIPGSTGNDGLSNIITLNALGDIHIVVVALEVIINDAEGRFLVSGRAPIRTVTAVNIGDALEHDGTDALVIITDGAAITIGWALISNGSGSDANTDCLFDGIHGFGGASVLT